MLKYAGTLRKTNDIKCKIQFQQVMNCLKETIPQRQRKQLNFKRQILIRLLEIAVNLTPFFRQRVD